MSSVQLASTQIGVPVNLYAVTVGGTNAVGMRFKAPVTGAGFQWSFFGKIKGSPGSPLSITLYSDGGQGTPSLPKTLIETQTFTATATQGWQGPVTFASSLTQGTYYWIVYKCSSAPSGTGYTVCLNHYIYSADSLAFTTSVPLSSTPITSVQEGAIFQLTVGAVSLIAPAQTNTGGLTAIMYQSFVAPSALTFNVIWICTSDRAYDTSPLTMQVLDSSGAVLASAQVTMDTEHGTGTVAWIPIVLNNTVTLTSGATYTISYGGGGAVHQLTFVAQTNPISQGFQKQSSYFTFVLAQGNLIDHYFEYESLHQSDTLTTTTLLAARWFNASASTLTSVDVRINGVYHAGSLQAQLWSDNGMGVNTSLPNLPVVGALGTISVSSPGWVTVTFPANITLNASTYYWLVFSAASGSFDCTRLVNPYFFKVAQYYPATGKWGFTAQGPTDLAIRIVTGAGEYRKMLDILQYFRSSPTVWYAQSFTAAETTQVGGIAVEIESGAGGGDSSYSDCFVGLYSDVGGNPGILLTSGTIPQTTISLQSLVPCQFSAPMTITTGTRYWIVVHGTGQHGDTRVYLRAQRQGFESDGFSAGTEQALVTTNSGGSWSQPIVGRTMNLVFALFAPMTTLVNTQIANLTIQSSQ